MTRALRPIGLVLALVGVGVASYLTYVHYSGVESICAIAHGCEVVQHSEWSKILGVPVALVGLLGYVSILAALVVGGEYGRLGAMTFAWMGAAFSGYLTYRELFTINATCMWCVISAVLMTSLAVVTAALFLTAAEE